jgi:TolB-like protein
LPFAIVGPVDEAATAFRDGLAEDLSRCVSRIRELRLASRTSTRALSGKSVREIAGALEVAFVLEGSVQRAGPRARVQANLVEAAIERPVTPTITVECALDDPLTAQDRVAREIADAVALFAGRPAPPRREVDREAYHALQRGLHEWRSCFAGTWRPALDHLQYAIARDPQFAAAHVALANAYNFLGFYSLIKPALAFEVAVDAAVRAAEIDPGLASAYRELALAKLGGEWDWEAAEASFRRAIALDSTDPLTRVHYSWLLALLGRDEAADAEAQRGQALASTSRLVTAARAQMLYICRRFDEAIGTCDECLAIDADYVYALHLRGLCYLANGREQALEDLTRATTLGGRSPFYLGLLGHAYAQFGRRPAALAVIDELDALGRETYIAPQCYVFIYAGLGERDRALEFQERAYADGASPFNYLVPTIRELYALDPYHKKRLEQMRLTL